MQTKLIILPTLNYPAIGSTSECLGLIHKHPNISHVLKHFYLINCDPIERDSVKKDIWVYDPVTENIGYLTASVGIIEWTKTQNRWDYGLISEILMSTDLDLKVQRFHEDFITKYCLDLSLNKEKTYFDCMSMETCTGSSLCTCNGFVNCKQKVNVYTLDYKNHVLYTKDESNVFLFPTSQKQLITIVRIEAGGMKGRLLLPLAGGEFRRLLANGNTAHYLYITSNEDLVLGGFHFNSKYGDEPQETNQRDLDSHAYWVQDAYVVNKIVMSNNPELIAKGMQDISNDFLKAYLTNQYNFVKIFHKYHPLLSCCRSRERCQCKGYIVEIPVSNCTCEVGSIYNNTTCIIHGSNEGTITYVRPSNTIPTLSIGEYCSGVEPLKSDNYIRRVKSKIGEIELLGEGVNKMLMDFEAVEEYKPAFIPRDKVIKLITKVFKLGYDHKNYEFKFLH